MTHQRIIKAALIDMDGTLYNSMPNHAKAWMRLMREKGLEAREEEFFLYEGMTGAAIIDKMVRRSLNRPATDIEMKEFYAIKAKYFTEMPPVKPIPGAREMVDAFHARGIITVLVTGSGQNSLLNRLESDFPGAFPTDMRVTSASVSRGKPFPDPYLRGLELAGITAREAVAIDNAPLGTRSANAAGILTVGVVTGPLATDDLAQAGSQIVYNSMADCAKMLPDLLDKIEAIAR
ncbi:MAG: HAD family phosphatase [Odoribacter sp.]|nr:HAD family phosphatase [Odoribacter sp.]